MNSKEHIQYHPGLMYRLMKWPLLCGCLSLLLARAALAADVLYENNGIVSYPGTTTFPPQIDALNFVNNNLFTINFTTLSFFYETSDTINYTNNGTMAVNTGFNFDTQSTDTGLQSMAGSFNNPGTITCGSTNLLGTLFFGTGQFNAWATNIINPGTVDVGENGLMKFTGQNLNLSRSTLKIEEGGANATGSGTFGLNTNEWDPSAFLGPDFAVSAPFPAVPFELILTNSTAYINVKLGSGGSNNIIRAVFIQDNSDTNVSYNVYLTAPANLNAVVQWAGAYLDPASGVTYTNYLYLTNNYALGASTNVALINGFPDNFQFGEGNTPAFFGTPDPAGFLNIFPVGSITNLYSFANVQLFSGTETTNSVANFAITNLTGRIQLAAANDLNLTRAHISGLNYLSVQSTNQFDGSGGALIQAPYSDINVGVTNGFLTISNLTEARIPNWSGNVQAWNTRWITVDNGLTNDYRVLIVGSKLVPTSGSQVQDMTLHGTNTIVISDVLNIIRNFSADAQNLILTTNGPGVGATSLSGELNLDVNSIFWQNALPNLRNLTNNGAISSFNQMNFGSSAQPYFNFVNRGSVSNQTSIIYANNFESYGSITNGPGSFQLQSLTSTFTNDLLAGGGDISITADSLVTSNLMLQAGRSLTLQVTNLLTDSSLTNGNIWTVGGSSSLGMNLPIKPMLGDLLGTTITNIAQTNKDVISTWAGEDRGASISGYTNNAAIGRLIIDSFGDPPNNGVNSPNDGVCTFYGTGASNALYVDYLELRDQATNRDSLGNPIALANNSNLVIYYANAVINGVSVAEKLNHKNNDHLRWVPSYAGHFSSTNLVYDGTTNTVNTGLAQSTDIDSDGDGTPNAFDPTPFFVSGEVNFTLTTTNVPPLETRLQWQTIPGATNYVFYTTNLLSSSWLTLTNFVTPAAAVAPITNTVFDTVGNPDGQRYYRVQVDPNTTGLYGP